MRATVRKTTGHRRGSTLTRSVTQRRGHLTEVKRGRKRSRRGFAAMDPMLQRRIAREGGRAVSRDRKHMAEIGRIGGRS